MEDKERERRTRRRKEKEEEGLMGGQDEGQVERPRTSGASRQGPSTLDTREVQQEELWRHPSLRAKAGLEEAVAGSRCCSNERTIREETLVPDSTWHSVDLARCHLEACRQVQFLCCYVSVKNQKWEQGEQ